jgi:DNA topoisomerase I
MMTLIEQCQLLQVLASYGHVRDLAEKPGSVKPEADFEMVWSTAGFAGRQRGLADIIAAIKAGS